jgi:hypothetical protein
VQNSVGGSGKDTWASFLNKYIPTYKYSIVDLPKEAAKVLGWDGGKTEKDRRFLSDIMDLSTDYNDAPFKDVLSLVTDFKSSKDYAEYKILIIDMRDPKDIARAVETFGAETILIRNPRVKKIETNHADRDVENYEYDYIIENDGTLEQLEFVARRFVNEVILCKENCDSLQVIYNFQTKKATKVFAAN